MWSIGATCDAPGRDKFDVYYKELISGKNEDHPIPAAVGKIECPMPTDHPVYDYMFEVNNFFCRCVRNKTLKAKNGGEYYFYVKWRSSNLKLGVYQKY